MARTLAAAAILVLAAPLAAETVLDKLPVTLRAGLASSGEPVVPGEVTLPDLPFSPERGFGHVGGLAGRRLGAATFGGDAAAPLAWREGMEKYVFRLPQGEYVVELTFLETDVAASGLRVFDIFAEDFALKDVDIAREGGDFTWVTLTARVGVFDGWLDLRFEPRTPERAPRVSRIRIFRASQPEATSPLKPALSAIGGPSQVLLEWEVPPSGVVGGYEVLRAPSSSGPFEVISTGAIHVRRFVDSALEPGREYFYSIRARSVDGAASVGSEAVSATARRVEDLGLQVMDLKVSPEDLRRASVQSENPVEVPGELHWLGDVRYVHIGFDTSAQAWQRKKSFHLSPQIERNRSIRRRKGIFLSAEAGDPTLLREKLSSDAQLAVGLASIAVEPVALLLNGVYQGVYFDVEQLDRRFRTRSRLDRVGVLALESRGDLLQWDWAPYGEQRGEEGNLIGLTELVHELNRLGEGEMPRFFEDRFYLDRWLDRTAVSLVRGAPLVNRFLLEDSRNRRWEAFEEKAPNGAFGVRNFEAASASFSGAAALEILEGRTLWKGTSSRIGPSVLETRLWSDPRHRELLAARLSAILSGPLGAGKLDALVDASFAKIRDAALCDPFRWPRDGGQQFLAGPARIKADHRARVAALNETAAGLRTRAPASLRLSGLLLRPKEGEPWIELKSESSEPLKLAGFFVTTEFHPRALRFALPPGESLAPARRFVWRRAPGPGFPSLDVDGGFLGLWKQTAPSSPPQLLDSIFYGRQTEGFSYARDAGGAWGFLASGAPASHRGHPAGNRMGLGRSGASPPHNRG